MNQFPIYFLIFLWLITIYVYQKKKRIIDSGTFLLSLNLICTLASLFLINNNAFSFKELKIFPFVFLYVMILIVSFPVLKYDTRKFKFISIPSRLLMNTISLIFILPTFIMLPEIITEFSADISKLFVDSLAGQQLYDDAWQEKYLGLKKQSKNIPAILSGAMSGIGILLAFYNLTLKSPNRFITVGLFVSIFILILPSISKGQRNGLTETLLVLIPTYLILQKRISSKLNNLIKITGIIIIILLSVPFVLLTNSRFDNNKINVGESIFYYAGQQNLFFNNFGLDNNGLRYGDRTFPFFKTILGFDNVPQNFWERRDKYPNLTINDEVFITFVGDFTLDFGPIVTLLFFLIISIIIYRIACLRNSVLYFHHLILIHLLIYVCSIGSLKLFPFSDISGNLKLSVYVITYFIFKYNKVHQHSNRVINEY